MSGIKYLLPVALLVVGCSSPDKKEETAKAKSDSSNQVRKELPNINSKIEDEPPEAVLSDFDHGESLYNRRSEKITGTIANTSNINLAIKHYERAALSAETTAALLKAYEFKGHFTLASDAEKEKTYEKAIAFGEAELVKYPNNVAIRYYYISNLARWGQQVGVIEASKNGLLNKIKRQAEEILLTDTDFGEAGAQRILGAMHLRVPKIPFVLKWPSKEMALELLSEAYNSYPENPANVMLYAEALIENKQEQRGRIILEELISRTPRKHRLVEDMDSLEQAKDLYKQEFL